MIVWNFMLGLSLFIQDPCDLIDTDLIQSGDLLLGFTLVIEPSDESFQGLTDFYDVGIWIQYPYGPLTPWFF